MIKFFKTNWPLILLGIIAILILGRILEIRRTQIPLIKEEEMKEKNQDRPIQTQSHKQNTI